MEKNPVLKKVAKGPPTSAWGKHAESVDHPQARIFGTCDAEEGKSFYESVHNNGMVVNQFTSLGDDRIMFKYTESRRRTKPDLHKGYLPAAVFVTSYARLYLWEELNKLGKRVLMHDTDSIIYTAAGESEGSVCYHGDYECEDCYDIEEGDCLGDWETESIEDKNDGINEFVAIGPKSYGIRCGNGHTSIKCKGACIKYSHSDMFNFDVMKEMVFNNKQVHLPQLSFDYEIDKGITTRKFSKRVRFDKTAVKGNYNKYDFHNYPYGYIE